MINKEKLEMTFYLLKLKFESIYISKLIIVIYNNKIFSKIKNKV